MLKYIKTHYVTKLCYLSNAKLSAICSHIYTPYAKHDLVIFYAVKKEGGAKRYIYM